MFGNDDDNENPGSTPAKRTGLARMLHGLNPLAKRDEGFNKIGAVIASGASVPADARKLALMLASYGEGDRLGKYAFSSTELAGRPAATRKDAHDREYDEPAVVGSLGISGARLRDAVAFLKERGWAKTTEDGEFASGCDFHEVSLTATGRSTIQGRVAAGDETLGMGMPSLDGPGGGFEDKPRAQSDRDTMMAMYAKAKVNVTVTHGEGVTVLTVNGLDHTFDEDGKLIGTAKAP